MVDAAGSLRPMIVFLDIPLSLPDISWLPVTILFCIFYAVVAGPHTAPKPALGKRIWKALTGWYLLLGCIAAGGGLYYLVEGYLPKQVAKGIDSFGISSDLTLPYPSGEVIHLHGSMLQLLFALLGLHLMARRTAMPQASIAVAEAQAIINTPPQRTPTTTFIRTRRREPAMTADPQPAVTPPPAARAAVTQERPAVTQTRPTPERPARAKDRPAAIPAPPPAEPPTCRLTTPPPIAIVMPRAATGIGKAQPCFVIGSLKPRKA